jgi:LysR family hydrogen peroxide-inducible transcriptional activator
MSLAGLSLRDLEYVVAVADCGHFGRAAARCAVSQPALSAQVRKLEAFLGVTIFERTPGRVLVTPRGEAVLERARQLLAEAGALLAAARNAGAALAGAFRLGAIPTLGPYLLPHVLKPLRQAFPEMQLVLSEARTAELVADLRDGRLDAALACLPVEEPALLPLPLFREPFVLMHPPGTAPAWPLPLAGEGLVLLAEGHCLRDQTLSACGPEAPRATRHATGLEMLRYMVAAGEGVSLMPVLAAAGLGEMDGLVTYSPLRDPDAARDVALLTRASDPRRAELARMARLLRSHVPGPAMPLGAVQPGPAD